MYHVLYLLVWIEFMDLSGFVALIEALYFRDEKQVNFYI